MKTEFTAEFFIGNRAKLRALFTGTAPIVIAANGLLQRATSETFPFKQDGSFWYLTGIDEPNILLVMDRSKEYLIVPELSDYQEKFDGELNGAEMAARSGVDEVLTGKEGWKQLATRLKKVKHIATIAAGPAFVDTYGMYTNPARAQLIRRLKKYNANLELLDLSQHLQRLRMVKQPQEIRAITVAIAATIHGLKYAEKKFQKGVYKFEREIEHDLSKQFWRQGAIGHSFSPIIASGSKSLIMHPVGNDGPINGGEQLLVDVGAEFDHYAADISRTWMPQPSKRFITVYEAVREVADYAMSILRPGVVLREYERKIETMMGEKLRELGLIKTIEHDAVRQYFPHSTSHFLGIDVHDVGDYEHPLDINAILTVEPGIYIPQEGIGIRIEDDVLITAEGCENLSASLSR